MKPVSKPVLIFFLILASVSTGRPVEFTEICMLNKADRQPAHNGRITEQLNGLDELIQSSMKDWDIPGLAICIVKDDTPVYLKGFGYRDLKNKLKVTPETLFPIASCTKAFTATALGILAGDKRFSWDKPVREYLPDFRLKDDYASEHMTTRDLVCHRTGLARHDYMWWHTAFSRRDIYERLRYLDFNRGFRESYQYNNLMFMTSGIVVEGITGTTWENFTRERILVPLEMYDTNFSISEMERSGNYAHAYVNRNGQVEEYSYCDMYPLGPAGSINSTARDMANWLIMNLNGGVYRNRQVIPAQELAEIFTPQVITGKTIAEDEMFYKLYAMGWGVTTYRGRLMIIHIGGIDGARSLVAFLPKEKIGVVVLTNIEYSSIREIVAYNVFDRMLGLEQTDWNRRFLDRAAKNKAGTSTQGEEGNATVQPAPRPLEDYTGIYENSAYGKITVLTENEKLKLIFNNIPTMLEHGNSDVFQAESRYYYGRMKFRFKTGSSGSIDGIVACFEPSVNDILFNRKD